MEKKLIFTRNDEKKGYPFFKLSSFNVWIAYKDGNKRTRYSIETSTTISQLLSGHVKELVLNKKEGLNKLIELVGKQQDYINTAIIYYKGITDVKNVPLLKYNKGSWSTITDKPLDKDFIVKYPFQLVNNNQLIIHL